MTEMAHDTSNIKQLFIRLMINGTEMRFPAQEFYFYAHKGEMWWYDCKMCRSMTQHPAGHLEWHLLKGDYGLTRNEQNGAGDEQQHQAGGEGAGLAAEVRPPQPAVQGRAGSAGGDRGPAGTVPAVDEDGVARPGP